MARYLSIEEVATALGTTDRTVRRMLNDGRLPGSQTKEKGKMVWRVHATKDLLEKLEKLYGASTVSVDSFEVEDSNESEEPPYEEPQPFKNAEPASSGNWHSGELERLKVVAEELAKALLQPMSEKIDIQARTIVEQEKQIENLQLQVRLLPDLQQQAQKNEDALNLKYAENSALIKQIEALQNEVAADKQKIAESEQLKEKIDGLTTQVKDLQRPWWKKLFGNPAEPA